MSDKYEYECALSGLVAPGDMPFEADGLDDLPPRWTELKFSRRVVNPEWVLIQQVKQAMVAGVVRQFPDNVREAQAVAVRVQVDAQFYAMEQDIPVYLTEVETTYLSPAEMSEDVAEALNQVRDTLGLDPIELDFDDEDEGDEEGAETPALEDKAAG